MKNPYTVLGVSPNADTKEIKAAYKKLAKKHHPDRNSSPVSEKLFKEINAANDIISDPKQRALFDEFGEVALKPGFDANNARAWSRQRPSGTSGFGFSGGFPGGGGGGINYDDLLGSLFGAQGGRQARTGADLELRLDLDPMITILGGERLVSFKPPQGTREEISVKIPAGAKDGGILRLKGKGAAAPGGGPCGDLMITMRVPDHPLLKRTDDNLEMVVPITILEAMQGGKITVPTPTGDIKVTIPKDATTGSRLRIKGRGVQRKGKPGDLFLLLQPVAPTDLSDNSIAAAQALEEVYSTPVRDQLKL